MKTQNVNLDNFKNSSIKKYFIGGEKKGFWAMLYTLSLDDCLV
jgi:hypothetical protein